MQEPGGVSVATAAHVADGQPMIVVYRLHVVYRVIALQRRQRAPVALARRAMHRPPPGLREIHALRGVSFIVRRGEAVGILGANGSGKSTLLRAIAGLVPPHSGAVYVASQASLLDPGAMMRDMSGRDNIVLGCLAAGMHPDQVRERLPAIAEFAGLGKFLTLPMNTYSTGMVARLRFAIAAANAHELLLIDEATAVGDAEFRRRSTERIRELREAAGAVLFVSHSPADVRNSCDRAIWLAEGSVVADGAADQVVATYEERQGVPWTRAESDGGSR